MPTKLIEYEVEWQQRPLCNHDRNVLFIEARNEEDAKILARDYIKRNRGIKWFGVDKVTEAKKMPEGGVAGSKYGNHHVRG